MEAPLPISPHSPVQTPWGRDAHSAAAPGENPIVAGTAPEPAEDPVARTRRLLAEAKAAFLKEQAEADAEEAAAGPSVFERGRRLVEEVRSDPVQAVTDRLDERLGRHRKAVALGLVAGGAVLLLQSRWVRRKALPLVASAGVAIVQDRVRGWFMGEDTTATPAARKKAGASARSRSKPPVDERPETIADTLDEREARPR